MFFVLFGFWMILNGKWTAELVIIGLVVSALLYLFIWKFLGYSPKKEWQALLRLPKGILYFGYMIKEIIKSAFATIKLIWSPKLETEPMLVTFRTKLKTKVGKVVLANSITMTPGTITVNIQDDKYLVHCLDSSMAEGLGEDMEKRVSAIEEVTKLE